MSYAQEKKVSVEASNQPISEILEQIENQGNYNFFYNNKLIKLDKLVSVSLRDGDIRTVLNQIFRDTDIAYSIVDDNIVLSVKKPDSSQQPSESAQARLTGKVVDRNNIPVIGATIIVDGTMQGTNTNVEGVFTLPWSASLANATLTVSSVGYESQKVEVGGRTTLNIVMDDDMQEIETVVVTALGIRREERAVPYNVQTIAGDDMLGIEPNFVNSLAGKIAGVNINASSAGIGGETKVVMRGNKSIPHRSTALYVIDGIPMPSLSLTEPGKSYTMYAGSKISGDAVSNLNPEDFESITVLTGPSAAALYGSMAANGVIMINTKRGGDRTSVSYSTNTTFMSPFWMPEFQNSYGARDGYYSSWGSKLSTPSSWQPKDFFQTGYNTTHNVSLSVGGEKNQTYASVGLVEAHGLVKNNNYGRKNFTISNSTSFLDNKMQLSLSGMYINVDEQNMLAGGQYYNPLIPVYLMSPSDDINKYSVYERYDASRNFPVQYWPWGSQSQQMQNPYWIINRNMFNTHKDRFIFSASLKYDIADWISVTGRARIDYNNSTLEQKNYASTSGLFAGDNGRYYWEQYTTRQNYGDVMVNINKYFADNRLSLTAVLGASVQDLKYRSSLIGGDLITVPNLFTFANIDTSKSFTKSTYNDQTQSVFGTVQLGWDRMVYLDVTARSDWTSSFYIAGEGAKAIFYPSVGLSGIITDIFDIKSDVLSFAKIRASYAEVGNATMRFIGVPTYPVSSGNPVSRTYVSSDNFVPERTKSWEFGAEVRLWGNKLALNGTYYTSRTYNQVFEAELPPASQYDIIYINAGRVDNKGIEFSAELNQKLGPVHWQSNLIYTRNKNKIVKLVDNYRLENGESVNISTMDMGGTTGVKLQINEGGKIGDIYVNTLKPAGAGYIWDDTNKNKVAVDNDNFVYAGNSNPSYMMSWRNGLDWKGLQLSFMFSARVGGVGASLTQAAMDYFGVSKATAVARDNGGALVNGVRLPADTYYEVVANNGTSAVGSMYIYSMTNIRLSELSLGYDVPITKWVPWIKGLNVSFIANNLWMLYCKAPFDPELVAGTGTYSSGIDYFQLPSTRNLGFSVKLRF
ncbi:MAG: SusC/RagA family TonB-linked outer membrane protein [Alistipes sp.]|nr:SusC/RagA family TonB-linked outer membrane protein [Alistipes sp.]